MKQFTLQSMQGSIHLYMHSFILLHQLLSSHNANILGNVSHMDIWSKLF